MGKNSFKFNPETLQYEKEKLTIKERIQRSYSSMLIGAGVSVILAYGLSKVFLSQGMHDLREENSKLLRQYELLNKDLGEISKVLEDIQYRDDNIYRVIFESDPISPNIRKAGFGGINRYADLESLKNSDLVINTTKKLDVLTGQMYVQSKSYDELMKLALGKEKMLASIPSIQPVANKDLKRVASGWGTRIDPVYKIPKFHSGMDFASPIGTHVFATGNGTVAKVISSKSGYGKHVVIDHGYGYQTLYGHMSAFNVKVGDKVNRGDIIGFVGSTGKSTGPHLHYEVHKSGKAVNPQNYYFQDLTPQEYERMIEISSNMGQSFD